MDFMADYGDITQDIVEVQGKLQELVAELRTLDSQRAQLVSQFNSQQGIFQFLLDKIPVEDRESILNPPQIEESADSDS